MESTSLELKPASTLGQYEIRGRIGSGGMGEVYDAVHTALGKRVAIKTLRRRYLDDETVVTRFLREGQLASRIRHPNIVDVTDVGLIDGLPCLVMEHLEGETLSSLVKRDGPVPLGQLVDLLLPIVAALDFAHEHGVLHRDLKPSNIFLSRSWNGEVTSKVLDFGISKLVGADDPGLTTDSAFVGTPHYASPESMRGEKMDQRADQYSMGVVLYEATTGVRPFADRGFAFGALALAICEADYRKPREIKPDLPEAFERVVLRAMELEPADRYGSMRKLGEALLPFASERMRMIWGPTFTAAPGSEPPHHNETAVMVVRPSGPTSVGTRVMTSSANVPAVVPTGWPMSSGAQPIAPLTPRPFNPSATPPPMMDRTPSYAQGVGTSMHSMHLPPKKAPVAAILAGVGALLFLLVGIGLVATRATVRGASAQGEPATSAAPTGDGRYTVSVQTTPEGAVLELDGAVAGTGQIAQTFPRDGKQHVLRISAAGYESLLVQFDEGHAPPARVVLRPSPGASSPATKPQAPTTPVTARPGTGNGTPAGKATGTGRPKTDNIDPWE